MKPVVYLHEWNEHHEPGMAEPMSEVLDEPPVRPLGPVTPLYAIPEGWTVVPKEPTEAQDVAGREQMWKRQASPVKVYRAMIAAVEDCG
jgi:hypothetical protein